MVVEEFGGTKAVEDLGPDDFQRLMETRLAGKALRTRTTFVTFIRLALFTFAFNDEQRLISVPVLFGPAFRKPKLTAGPIGRQGKGEFSRPNKSARFFHAPRGRTGQPAPCCER